MERQNFIEQLLKIAFASMVCDGDIAPEEEEYLQDFEKHDFYLKEFDLAQNLTDLKREWELKGMKFCEQTLNSIYKLEFSETQKLIALEFAIDIVRSDGKMEQLEIDFVSHLIVNLRIPSEIVSQRFGNWEVIERKGN